MIRSILAITLLLSLAGCGHRESSQAAVHLGVTLDAIMAAKTMEQVKAICAWAKQLAEAIAKREAAGLSDPPAPAITTQEVLDATDPGIAPEQRAPAALKVRTVLSADLQKLDQAKASDAAVAGAINWVVGLVAATTAGGAGLALLGKVRTIIQTARKTAEVAFDGYHQAQTALRQISPEAADAIDAASLNLQEHLPPAVKALGDVMVAKAKAKAKPRPKVIVPAPRT